MRADPDDAMTQAGDPGGQATAMTTAGSLPDDPILLDPTEAEVDAWAEAERKRREEWLKGPTADERAAYVRRERERRLAELIEEREVSARRAAFARRYGRETQLAAEGAVSLLWKWSRRNFEEMVRAGREFEDEFGQPSRRRRVPFDDEVP